MTAEGDVEVSDNNHNGAGIILYFLTPFFDTFITAIVSIYQIPPRTAHDEYYEALYTDMLPQGEGMADDQDEKFGPETVEQSDRKSNEPLLIAILPNPGYFLAGGISGIVSRSTTAPLDRLKVYLIAQTKNAEQTINAAKSGAAIDAIRGAWRTSAEAMKDLWAAGGIRSLYAGNIGLLEF